MSFVALFVILLERYNQEIVARVCLSRLEGGEIYG